MEAAVAALEAAAEKTAGAALAAKEAALAASAAATEAAGAAMAAKEAAMAAAVAARESAAAAAATAKELAAAMLYSNKRRFHEIDGGGSGGGNRDNRGNLDLIGASPTRSSAASSPSSAKEPAAAAAATAKEPAGAMRYSKKRIFHQIGGGGSGGGNCDDRGNLDLISSLPDAVLGSIISLLPTKDGARTQAISRRWLLLWRSAPLNLVVHFEAGKKRKLIASVSKILSEHRGPARRLSFRLFIHAMVRGWERRIDGWLSSQALDGLQELDFTYTLDMPLSVFRSAPTLRFAKCSYCNFPEWISTMRLNFPCLKQLTLCKVTITEDGLNSLLSGCTVLESLELRETNGIGGLCISSQTLRSLGFSSGCKDKGVVQLVIKDAPSLERLLPLKPNSGPVIIRVVRAPKLELLGMLSKVVLKCDFGIYTIQKMVAVSLTTKIHTMKVLVVDSVGPNLDPIVDFLKYFPCLVRLYVISHPTKDMDNARKYDPLDPIECLERSLKEVVLMNYDGSSVDFAKFFILNTKLLKEMDIEVLDHRTKEWVAYQHRQLCVENRASRDARIELKISTKKNYKEMDTHDLSLVDPFGNRYFR